VRHREREKQPVERKKKKPREEKKEKRERREKRGKPRKGKKRKEKEEGEKRRREEVILGLSTLHLRYLFLEVIELSCLFIPLELFSYNQKCLELSYDVVLFSIL
jgi:hypothetical protein